MRTQPKFKDWVPHEAIALPEEEAFIAYSAAHRPVEMSRLIAQYAL